MADAREIRDLINARKRRYRASGDQERTEKARRYLRGDFLGTEWASRNPYANTDDNRALFFTSKNLIYAIVDSATTGLVGDNPRVSVRGENPTSVELAPIVNGRLDKVFATNKIRETCVLSITDAVTTGCGVFKTRWSTNNWSRRANKLPPLPMAEITAPDPVALFFDDDARLPRDITYYLECTPVRRREMQRRIKTGLYKGKDLDRIETDRYPAWLSEAARTSKEYVAQSNYLSWAEMWEFYDLDNEKVYHYHAGTEQVLLEADLDFPCPYSVYNLNHNGVDSRGLSEAQLILGVQEAINDLLTLLKEVTYGQIPRVGYNAAQIDPDDLNEWLRSPVGSFVPLQLESPEKVDRMQNLFYRLPYAEHPEGVKQMLDILEEVAAFVSALADAARGQITNARTATEVAVMQAQMNSRLSGRRSRLFDAVADVAQKVVTLDRMFLDGKYWVRTAGRAGPEEFDPRSLRGADLEFEYIPWNPIQQNPLVILESSINLYELLVNEDKIDRDEFVANIARGLGISEAAIRPDKEVAQMRQERAAAMTGPAGGAEGQPGPAGDVVMPPLGPGEAETPAGDVQYADRGTPIDVTEPIVSM